MVIIKGYKYTNEEAAANACNLCSDYYGIPVTPDDVTQNWVEYQCAELNKPQFWFIVYDESLLPVLGEPIEFEVETPPFPPM